MRYSLKIKRSALREIKALPRPDRVRVVEGIDRLPDNPHVGRLLKGDLSGLRRIRVGVYRIVYEINEGEVLVLILRVAHRRNAYR